MNRCQSVGGVAPMAPADALLGPYGVDARTDGFCTGGLETGDVATPMDFLDYVSGPMPLMGEVEFAYRCPNHRFLARR